MNKQIVYKNSIHQKNLNLNIIKNLNKKFNNVYQNIILDLNTPNNVYNTLSKSFKLNFNLRDIKKFKKFHSVVIIGMGGSILGAESIYSFLKKKIKKNFTFIDDIDDDKLKEFKKKNKLNKILFIVISKSGNTIETISNLLAFKIVKKNSKNIIIISEKNNALHSLSKKMKIHFIEHKKYIGGRYSVLSEVGMVPAYLMGVNIKKIRKNILKHFNSEKKKFLKSSSIILANIIKKNKIKNLVFFNYLPELNEFLYWLQQLIAESLGKGGNGFLPIISKAPKDHHSLLQLYLDGPKDKIFYVFSGPKNGNKKLKPKIFNNKFKFLQNKSLYSIKNAQKIAFVEALKKNKIPFREFRIKEVKEEILGELLSFFILETSIIGKLININPFNQPAVEQVKVTTKKLLI